MSQSVLSEIYRKLDDNDEYERTWGYINPTSAAYWRMRDEIVFENILKEFDPLVDPLNILEIGTGHGHELAKFAQMGIHSNHLIGIDFVIERIIWAANHYPSITFLQQDGAKLAFADQSFDIVFEFNCLAHAETVEAQQLMCSEMTRILRPGGLIIWFDMAPPSWRTVAVSRFCSAFSSNYSYKKLISVAKKILTASLNPKSRYSMVKQYGASYLLPIASRDIDKFFSNLIVHSQYAGLDYTIWKFLWERNRTLAQYLWRTGWFWRHSFAVIKKPSMKDVIL